MTITAHVHDHRIVLPEDLVIADGAEVQIILPEQASGEAGEGALAWMLEFAGTVDSLPPDAAERHNELAHGRKLRLS